MHSARQRAGTGKIIPNHRLSCEWRLPQVLLYAELCTAPEATRARRECLARERLAHPCYEVAGKLHFLPWGSELISLLSSSGGGLFGRSVTFGSGALFNFGGGTCLERETLAP